MFTYKSLIAFQAAIASEQAKQQAGQMDLTAGTANAANQLNALIASEQAKQAAGQQAVTTSSTNATNAANMAIAKEQAAQQAAQMTSTVTQNNIQNGLSALNASINAYATGLTGAQGLAAIDTAYNNNANLVAGLLNSTDASARAAGQALAEATKAAMDAKDALDLTKAQAGSGIAGLSQNPSNTQVKVTGTV